MTGDTKLQQLFHLLRIFGAAMIVAAAGTFLVQSWDEAGGVMRYLALLGMTALLPVVVYLCGVRFQEGKSARVMTLSFLALVPIHAGVLGGFVLSQFGTPSGSVAPVAQWVAPSPTAALLLVGAAAVVLLPLSWAAFRVLARPHANLLLGCSAVAHALMLIPVRTPLAAALSVMPIVALAGWCAKRVEPRTRESRLAVSMLLAPAAVIAARQALFYDASNAFWAALLGAVAALLVVGGRRTGEKLVERAALVPTLLASGILVEDVAGRLATSASVDVLSYGWLSGVALLAIAWRSKESGRFFVLSATAVNAVTATIALTFDGSPLAALQMMGTGLGLCSYGFLGGRRLPLLFGIGLAGVGFVAEVAYAVNRFEPAGWLALAASGTVLIAVTAWLERRARAVRLASPSANVSLEPPASVPRWQSNAGARVAE